MQRTPRSSHSHRQVAPLTGVLLLHSFFRMVIRMVTFLQERPSSLPGGTGRGQLWLRSACRGQQDGPDWGS